MHIHMFTHFTAEHHRSHTHRTHLNEAKFQDKLLTFAHGSFWNLKFEMKRAEKGKKNMNLQGCVFCTSVFVQSETRGALYSLSYTYAFSWLGNKIYICLLENLSWVRQHGDKRREDDTGIWW